MSEHTDGGNQLYRSHFLGEEQLADRATGQRANFRDDVSRVEPVEKEVENGWLNVRIGDGDWASAREFSRVSTDRTQQGCIPNTTPPAEWSEQPSYADPVADGMDPTDPGSPESRF